MGTGANYLAKAIADMSDNRLAIKVYAGGELVPPLGVFDAVSEGTAEMGHTAAYYWGEKHPAAPFFGGVPFGLNAVEMQTWLNFGGGQELWDELYAPFNLKPFAAGNTTIQMGGWFNKEIHSIDDFAGLKMRIPGLGGQVLSRLGAKTINLPPAKIVTALQNGEIDAAEWVGPYNDLPLGLHKAAKYYYWPGWFEPGTVVELMVNKSAYEALPADLKAIVKHAAQDAYMYMITEYNARNGTALVELITKHKVQLRRFPDQVLAQFGKVSQEIVAEVAAQDPFTQKVYDSFNAYREQAVGWSQVGEEGYSLARTLAFS